MYRMIGQTKTGFIVESMADGKRMPAFPSQQVSVLEEISIYTSGEDMPLKDVFRRIYEKESGGEAPDHKSEIDVIIRYFEEIVPEYDREMVRQSDMRKVLRWYNELLDGGLIGPEEDAAEDTEPTEETKSDDDEPESDET